MDCLNVNFEKIQGLRSRISDLENKAIKLKNSQRSYYASHFVILNGTYQVRIALFQHSAFDVLSNNVKLLGNMDLVLVLL